ncbi:UNVERIFIED_CONTAM: Homeobox-DDT domain protein RLT2 [Sesamum radiatum]|uniref:Homeobox-DDT domain protein RLT2 n=1 Tax=Sesamum radiatum TaxID=300843 RepID=A0AAW2V6X5_SESRA
MDARLLGEIHMAVLKLIIKDIEDVVRTPSGDILILLKGVITPLGLRLTIARKRVLPQRRSRHRLTPGTVKFAAYHVLALEGSKGPNVIEVAEKIQKSGLRDLTTARLQRLLYLLSYQGILYFLKELLLLHIVCCQLSERILLMSESIIAAAKEKIQRYANSCLADQNADEEERDDDSDSDVTEGTEVDALATPLAEKKILLAPAPGMARTGSLMIGLREMECVVLDRMDTANALKKQMWAEAQLDKRRMKEEFITKFYDSSFNAVAEGGPSPLVAENKVYDQSATTLGKVLLLQWRMFVVPLIILLRICPWVSLFPLLSKMDIQQSSHGCN